MEGEPQVQKAPFYQDGERQVLANLVFSENGKVNKPLIMASLEEADFYMKTTAQIFKAAKQLWARSEDIDQGTVAYELEKMGNEQAQAMILKAIGQAEVLPSVTDFNIGKLRECRRRRQAISKLHEAGSRLQDLDEDVEQVIASITHGFEDGAGISMKGEERLKEVLNDIQDAYGQDTSRACLTSYPSIDEATGGLLPGELVVIVGRPGAGKTWFWLNMLAHMARKDKAMLVASGELPQRELISKMVCRLSGLNYKRYRKASFTDAQLQKFNGGCTELAAYQVFPVGMGETLELAGILAMAQRFKPDVVAIDSCYNYRPWREVQGWEYYQEIARNLKAIAAQLEAVVLVTSQLGRSQQVAFTDAFQQDASLILAVEGEALKAGTTVKTLKARDCGHFKFELHVNFETSTVAEQGLEPAQPKPQKGSKKSVKPSFNDDDEIPF